MNFLFGMRKKHPYENVKNRGNERKGEKFPYGSKRSIRRNPQSFIDDIPVGHSTWSRIQTRYEIIISLGIFNHRSTSRIYTKYKCIIQIKKCIFNDYFRTCKRK